MPRYNSENTFNRFRFQMGKHLTQHLRVHCIYRHTFSQQPFSI